MKNNGGTQIKLSDETLRRSALLTVLFDVVLIAVLIVCLLIYSARNSTRDYEQNIENIKGISTASSQLMQLALEGSKLDILSAYNYCNGRTVDEILDYLYLTKSGAAEFQILCYDNVASTDTYAVYSGFSTIKNGDSYSPISYKNTALTDSLAMYSSENNSGVSFTQSFTNKTDASRYYAAFCELDVLCDGKTLCYYIIKPEKESQLIDRARIISQYQKPAVAICYTNGKYLACDTEYRDENFFDYIYKYNGLSVDEKNELKASVESDPDGSGVLTYDNYMGDECVFVYSTDDEGMLTIISVPTSEFLKKEILSFFPLTIIVFLFVLLIYNAFRFLHIVKELRLSVHRERNANASKSSFLSRMSHEIRTPINALIGYNVIAQKTLSYVHSDVERKIAETKVMDCLSKSEIASKHLLTIINDVLDMSAIDDGKIIIANERFDFRGLMTSLTTVFYSQARNKSINFDVIFNALTDEWFIGDQMRVNQILTNLLSNAIKFTPEGGSVILSIDQKASDDPDIACLCFKVKDTGIGMAQDYITHIWTPFEQADSTITRRFGGSGLGMSITKNLVDLMKGTISVESELGVGTTFTVELNFPKLDQPISVEGYRFDSIRALVVDNDTSACDYIRHLFNRCGASCVVVHSDEDAVKAVSDAKEQGKDYSVCLVDLKITQIDGIEIIHRIREIIGDVTPIVLLTAYDFTDIIDQADVLGVDRFISKPIFQSTLFDLLASLSGTDTTKHEDKNDDYNFNGNRVLLAEDNAMNMEIAKTIMESAGLVVDSAWNGREAVEHFESSEKNYYMAILMDVHMPEMNGHDATRTIRSSNHPEAKTIPIIAMTADAFAENIAESLASGMNDHISKPIDIPTLFKTLKKYVK